MVEAAWLIPASPLIGFVLLLAFGRRMGEPTAGWLATLASAGSFVATVITFVGLLRLESADRFFIQTLFTWVQSGSFRVDAGLLVDPLSITMSLFITGVGTLIHLYSIGYMHGDDGFARFFTYLNLFIASMLLLVLGDNLLLTFLGWEGVGACSYLLISFWFTDPANATAGKKAFVTNRVGDFGFMLAAFVVFTQIGSIRYADIIASSSEMSATVATVAVLLFLLAATGKSAQLPLFVWLPDAMAGPTPVSALIHAATMVTSGVFLLTRLNPILAQAETWSVGVIAWVGALTALFAATAAVAQTDIKRVLAYSTVSQLGYLFLAVGVGGYVAAIFHMVTHAFFKALLFMGSGSVIHGMADEQDMRRMGGLYKFMPLTGFTFIIGWLAIAGVPPFSGFWSKDEILLYAWNADEIGGKGLWAIGLITAILTAFYMTRQVILTFFGRLRYADVTAADLRVAAEARSSAITAGVEEAEAAVASAVAAVEKASNDLVKKNEAVDKARTKHEEATTALAALNEGEDGYDKAVKGYDRAEKAKVKAQDALVVANHAVDDAKQAVTDAEAALAAAQATAAEQANVQLPLVPAAVTAVTTEIDAGELADYLPNSYRERAEYHPHESPWTMTTPLLILAGLAAVAGVLNLPFAHDLHFLGNWLSPSLFGNKAELTTSAGTKWVLAIVAIVVVAVAIMAAIRMYLRGQGDPERIEKPFLRDAWRIDSSYANFFGGPGRALFDLSSAFDRRVVDGAVRGIAAGIGSISRSLKVIQSGFVRSYALAISIGTVFVLVWFLGRLFA